MKMTLTRSDIASALESDYGTDFSYYGANALADYLLDLEEMSGEEQEFDSVAIRCEFTEYKSPEHWAADYFTGNMFTGMGIDLTGDETPDDITALITEYIQEHGTLLKFTGGIIVSDF